MRRLLLVLVLLMWPAVTHAREVAHVVGTTRHSVFIDAGGEDGLHAGLRWQTMLDGQTLTLQVVAVTQTGAALDVEGGVPPAVGATLPLPRGLVRPPAPPPARPPPPPPPEWTDVAPERVLPAVRRLAARTQPVTERDARWVHGELSLSLLAAADLHEASTRWQDLALTSQLSIEDGAWHYNHLLEARLAGAEWRDARARLDVYLMRLEWAPRGGRVAAALGRQPAAPLDELGLVDGVRTRLVLVSGLDATIFAGLTPAADLGASTRPRAGVDVGWQDDGALPWRADLGLAVDLLDGGVDRAASALALTAGTRTLLLGSDLVVDAAKDARGEGGARVSRAALRARLHRGRLSAGASGGYDRPFLSRSLVDDLPALWLGARSYGQLDLSWAASPSFELATSARAASGDGIRSLYVDAGATLSRQTWRAFAVPHLVVGSFVSQAGLRLGLGAPVAGWQVDTSASFEAIRAGGDDAWLVHGRLSGNRPLGPRWRLASALELATGDGTPRWLAFVLIAYRLGN